MKTLNPNWRDILWVVCILGVAVILRSLWLGRESLWLDEAYSWWITNGSWGRATAGEPTNPPLYFVMLRIWIQFTGSSEAGLRSLSILGSLGSVYLVYLLGLELFDIRIARIGAAYQAVSTFQIAYAQEARCFAWLVFWLLLASYSLLRNWRRSGGMGWMALYFVAATLSLYTHFIAIFFLASHALISLWWWWRGRISRDQFLMHTGAGIAAGLAFLPWLAQIVKASAGGGQNRRYLLLKLPQTYFSFLFGDSLIPLDEAAVRDITGTLRENATVLMAVAIIAALVAPFAVRSAKRWEERWEFCLELAVLPVLVVFAVSFRVMILDERYVQGAAPFAYLLAAGAIMEAWQPEAGWRRWVLVGGYTALLGLSLGQYYFSTGRYGKEQWREVTQKLEAQADATRDLVLFEEGYVHYPYDYYQRANLTYWKLYGKPQADLLAGDKATLNRLKAARRVWYVRAYAMNGKILDILDGQLERKTYEQFPKGHGIEVIEYSRKGQESE